MLKKSANSKIPKQLLREAHAWLYLGMREPAQHVLLFVIYFKFVNRQKPISYLFFLCHHVKTEIESKLHSQVTVTMIPVRLVTMHA